MTTERTGSFAENFWCPYPTGERGWFLQAIAPGFAAWFPHRLVQVLRVLLRVFPVRAASTRLRIVRS